MPTLRRQLRGFSLVELLVVLLLVAILMALLIPVVVSARRSAKVTVCGSNLRQIGVGIQAYVSDRRRLPAAAVMPTPFSFPLEPTHTPLYDVLAPFIPAGSSIYRCPADESQVYDRCVSASATGRGISYLYVNFPDSAAPQIKDLMMWDYGGDSLHGLIKPFHKGGGGNTLYRDGSVVYKPGDRRD